MIITQPVNIIIENLPNHEVINPLLEADIKTAGDVTGGRSAAKCYRTQWDMHEVYPSFKKLTDAILEVVKRACGPATSTKGGETNHREGGGTRESGRGGGVRGMMGSWA